MQTVGDMTRLDTVKAAHTRACIEMLAAPVGELHGRCINIIELLVHLHVAPDSAAEVMERCTRRYQEEMCAAWTAVFHPIPIVKPKPAPLWKRAADQAAKIALWIFAFIGLTHALNDLTRILT